MRDPYSVLGVRQDARDDEIKAAWRARAKTVHPDRNRDDPLAAARFAEIGEAYELLKDPKKRNRYDQQRRKTEDGGDGSGPTIMQQRQAAREAAERARAAREEAARVMEELARANAQRAARAAKEAAAAGGETAEEVVNRIFGAGEPADTAAQAQSQSQAQAQSQAADSDAGASASPSAGTGGTAEAARNGAATAEDGGRGRGSATPLPVQAVALIGYWIKRLRGIEPAPEKAPDIVAEATVTIEELIRGARVGVTLFDGREVRFPLEPGMTDGHAVRIEGQGHKFQGMQRGDVRVTLKVARDGRFHVEGFDIHTVLPVTLENAVLGCETSVESPEGPVSIAIPPWSDSTQSIRIEGRGLPSAGGTRGDLVVELRLVLWEKPDDKVTDLMRHMREGLYL